MSAQNTSGPLDQIYGAFRLYVKHRDLAAAAGLRASRRTGGTRTWQREIDNHDRHLEAAEEQAAIIVSAIAKARGE